LIINDHALNTHPATFRRTALSIPSLIRESLRLTINNLSDRQRVIVRPEWKIHEQASLRRNGYAGYLLLRKGRDFLERGLLSP
jgi:hypothetical protein